MKIDSSDNTSLGVVAICKNEEEDMPGFINHLAPWVDEIVIVDDGSTDRTLDIVRSIGSKVMLIEHPQDESGFAGQRNIGIQAANSDWLLHMDIDMRVPPELAFEIVEAIKCPDKDGYCFKLLNYFLQHPINSGGWEKWNYPWLARNEKHHFENRLHENCVVDTSPDRIGQLKNKMWHLNDKSYAERLEKNIQYSKLEAERITASGKKIGWKEILLKPIVRGLKAYFLYSGYRAGLLGLIFSLYVFTGTFNWYASAWDLQNKIDRGDLEKSLDIAWKLYLLNLKKIE